MMPLTMAKAGETVTIRVLALPIFAAVMLLIYSIAMGTSIADGGFAVGAFATDWANDTLFGEWVPGWIGGALTALGVAEESWLFGLITDGIIGGVGAVLGFVPQMLVLFLLLAALAGILCLLFRKGYRGEGQSYRLTSVSAAAAERIMDRLREKKFPYSYQHLNYDYGGHLFVPMELRLARFFKGDRGKYREPGRKARMDSLTKTLEFVSRW